MSGIILKGAAGLHRVGAGVQRVAVVTVPIFLRYIMVRNSIVLSRILEIIISDISGYYKAKAKKIYGIRGGSDGMAPLWIRWKN